ncbi:MAG: pilus assembly protein [Gammaproteobacteria bacterium]|nr:MAG: pilus assembly protein [Gammaproteobacteria bacterium]RKZ41411.1 MAG: pilus assembly protein [Gammaproteobacteria bacterium]RKZ74746.1 MAG: pilus assembly protein [Gammaproteobacteria bacterium]
MFYFDTCFLVPLFLPEATSDSVETFIMSIPTGQLATSYWTQVEFASLLGLRVRMQTLEEAQALQLLKDFEEYLINSYYLIMPAVDDFELATQLLQNHQTGLRGGDALHLAISKNRHAECLYTLDNGLIQAASLLDIPAELGIQIIKG